MGRLVLTRLAFCLCGDGGCRNHALVAAIRLLQISRSNLVTVNITGPKIRPDGPKTISAPTIEMNARAVCIFNRLPTNNGYSKLSIPPTTIAPQKVSSRAFPPLPSKTRKMAAGIQMRKGAQHRYHGKQPHYNSPEQSRRQAQPPKHQAAHGALHNGDGKRTVERRMNRINDIVKQSVHVRLRE